MKHKHSFFLLINFKKSNSRLNLSNAMKPEEVNGKVYKKFWSKRIIKTCENKAIQITNSSILGLIL